jgi:hypothetical protein
MQVLRIQRQKVQTVISCAFNNKKLVHFFGIIIVRVIMFVACTLGGTAKPHMNESYRALNVEFA